MSYFLSIAGSQTKFSKSGFLLRTTGSILEQRAIELRAIHAVDLPVAEIGNRDLTAQFIANTTDQVQQAAAILLLTPATKESVPTLLLTLLEQLPDNSFFNKPVLLFATGGLPAHVAVLERALRHELLRLGTTTIAARVHIGSGNWITVGNDRPRLSRGAETEIAYCIEIVLRGIRLKECKDFSRELAERQGSPAKHFLAGGGVDVQLTEKYLVIPDPLIEPLRRLEIAAEWFRVAYRMNKDPRQNPHLYRQLAEMKRQIEALETELQGDGPVKRN